MLENGYVSPSMRREWIEISIGFVNYIAAQSLPPCGGSGLKLYPQHPVYPDVVVSLHAEGVD